MWFVICGFSEGIFITANVVLERNGQTETEIDSTMKTDVHDIVYYLITGGPQEGFTFNETYIYIGDPQQAQDYVCPTSEPSMLPPTDMMGKEFKS